MLLLIMLETHLVSDTANYRIIDDDSVDDNDFEVNDETVDEDTDIREKETTIKEVNVDNNNEIVK